MSGHQCHFSDVSDRSARGPITTVKAAIAALRFGADSVAKLGEEQLVSNNVQQSNRDEQIFESTLRIGA